MDSAVLEGNTCLLTFNSPGLAVENKQADSFRVFPNPTAGEIQLSYHGSTNGKVYSIFDATGSLVLSGRLSDTNARIDLRSLPEGVYVLMVDGRAKRVVKE